MRGTFHSYAKTYIATALNNLLGLLLRYPTTIVCLTLILLLVLSSQPAVLGSSPPSTVRTAAALPSGVHSINGLSLVTQPAGVKPLIVKVKATAGGYGQNDTHPQVAGGI